MSTENLKELRNALSCWQDDYDCDDDKEQYDMFGAAIDAVSRLEAAERANYAQSDHINQQQDRIDSLEQKNAALGNALGTAERERDDLRAEQAEHDDQTTPPAASAPDGYRTVPIAPTAEMLRVGGNVYEYCEENGEYPYDAARGIYSIMISAAPAPGGDAE
ncbi:hypothetical protein VRB95_08385 [Erwinia aphidicola]|uniref:hypothetical protein n=1 Tax=Erwinia aphidicola TaxID=68334 RepID=UPI0030CF2D8E